MRFLILGLLASVLLGSVATADDVEKDPVCHVTSGDRPAFDYRYGDVTYKPYVLKLYTPSGINILRDAPSDHPHHHGLMLAFTVDGCDFWDERPASKPGKQVMNPKGTPTKRVCTWLDWIKDNGTKVLFESRRIKSVKLPDVNATVIDWTSTLKCVKGQEKVEISGRHYFGLGMRFVESMDKGGRFFFGGQKGESDLVRGDERVTQAQWAAYTAHVDGKPVTVAIFDGPKNPIPMHAFTMGDKGSHFAYLAATLNLYKRPLEIKAGNPVSLRWGVALWDGEIAPAEVEAAYQAWLKK